MTANQYKKLTKPFVEHPMLTKGFLVFNQLLTGVCYVMYPLLILLEWYQKNPLWLKSLLTASISFVVVSVFRRFYNKQRPYERLDIVPLIAKDTVGKSFPSRHVFSVFVIAMCWLMYCPVVGVMLMIIGIGMAFIRVVGGVHDLTDVIAGAVIGVISGVIGLIFL